MTDVPCSYVVGLSQGWFSYTHIMHILVFATFYLLSFIISRLPQRRRKQECSTYPLLHVKHCTAESRKKKFIKNPHSWGHPSFKSCWYINDVLRVFLKIKQIPILRTKTHQKENLMYNFVTLRKFLPSICSLASKSNSSYKLWQTCIKNCVKIKKQTVNGVACLIIFDLHFECDCWMSSHYLISLLNYFRTIEPSTVTKHGDL